MPVKTHGVVGLEVVLDAMEGGLKEITVLDGIKVSIGSSRMRTYTKGVKCANCGIQGRYWAVQNSYSEKKKTYDNAHLNLYAVNEHGHSILMTSDHIIPKAAGGSDELSNRQPMCEPCNHKKADKLPNGKKASDLKRVAGALRLEKYKCGILGEASIDVQKMIQNIASVKSQLDFFENEDPEGNKELREAHILRLSTKLDNLYGSVLSAQRRLLPRKLRKDIPGEIEANREMYLEWRLPV